MILKLIAGTYTSAYILLTQQTEDKNFPYFKCHVLKSRVAKDKALKTGYSLNDSIKMTLLKCIRVLNMKSEKIT